MRGTLAVPWTPAARRAVAAALALAVSTVLLMAFHLRLGAGLQESAADVLFITRGARPFAPR